MDDQLVQNINYKKQLPIELIYIILLYLRQPQSAILLKDITSFSKTRTNITNIYYKKWIVSRKFIKGEDINWLENDLILYANENAPTGVGLQPKFKEILGRFCNIKKASRLNFQKYACSNKLSAKTRANMLWGLFTSVERDEFVELKYDGTNCYHLWSRF
jgi:hypothetical protein